jgi:hypothetical protein
MSYEVLVRLLLPDEPAQGWRADRVEAERTTTDHGAAPYGSALTVLAPDLAGAADVGRVEKRLLLFVDARHKAANRGTVGQRRRNALIEGFTKLAGDGLAAFKTMIR